MTKKITKALIPAAGFGTRFLPQTKAMPKEMMPLVDKPIIQRVVEELVDADIETIVIVTGSNKRAIEDHFDEPSEDLVQNLINGKKQDLLEEIKKISNLAEFVYIRQKGPEGNATPILNAKHIMRDDPFLVFWGDDFIDANPPRAKQLIEAYEKYQTTILGALKATSDEFYDKYGVVGGEEVEDGVMKVNQIIEKPGKENAPSDLGIASGYVYTSDIFEAIEEAKKKLTAGEELVYTLAVDNLIKKGINVHALEIKNAIFRDTGNKLEYMKTVVDLARSHPQIGEEFTKYLKNLVNSS